MSSRNAARIASMILLLAASRVQGSPTLPEQVEKAEYAARRKALAGKLRQELPPGGLGIFVVRSAAEQDMATFRQESNLYYLTGTEIPESVLLLAFTRAAGAGDAKTAGVEGFAEYFYLPDRDVRQEKWTGPKPSPGGLDKSTLQPDAERRATMELLGFAAPPAGEFPPRRWPTGPLEQTSSFPRQFAGFLSETDALFFSAEAGVTGEPISGELAFLNDLRARYPNLRIEDPRKTLARLRMVKSPAEIRQIRRAVEITCKAFEDALPAARAGAAEFEVQAEVERRFTRDGARRPAYPSIVGSGPNSCVLHYDASERTMLQGDLLLMDVGAEFRHYAADVTRTYPVGGRFSEEQRKIYALVLEAQEAVLRIIKPGIPFADLDRTARKIIVDAGYGPQFLHGTSHFLGLDVHDAGDGSALLEPGMVFTVEPGVYLPDRKIGVRIEDDVLVTPSGAEVLSRCLPRTADAVEMQIRNAQQAGTR